MSESSEESDDPLYGEDSSLTDGVSSDEYSSDELRRRILCSGSSSSTGVDSSSTSESYDEDESDAEVIKFSTDKQKKRSFVGFKATPYNIETFLKADPVLNGSDILKGPQDVGQSGRTFEWSTSGSSEDEGASKANSGQMIQSSQGSQKTYDRNEITVAFSIQEAIKGSQELEMDQDLAKMEKANAKPKARKNTLARKPNSAVKSDNVSSDDKGTRSRFKPKPVDNRMSQDTNLLLIKGKLEQGTGSNTEKRISTLTKPTMSALRDNNLVKSSQGRSSKKTVKRR